MPRAFSLDKFKHKVGRRSSEPLLLVEPNPSASDRRSSTSNPSIVISDPNPRNHADDSETGPQYASLTAHPRLRAHGSTHAANTSKKQVKELIKQESAHIILKKLVHTLHELGLQNPIPLKATNGSPNGSVSKTTKLYVANTNDCIYLAPASLASFTYEDVENGGNASNSNNLNANDLLDMDSEYNQHASHDDESAVVSDDDDPILSSHFNENVRRHSNSFNNSVTADPNLENIPSRLQQKMDSFSSPNYLCTKIDSDKPIPHTFAVIIELSKDTRSVRDVKFEFQSMTNILWPTGDPYSKGHVRERFRIGHMEWNTSLGEADYYINSSNTNDVKTKKLTPDDLARRTREYKLINIRDLANGVDKANKAKEDNWLTTSSNGTLSYSTPGASSSSPNDVFKAGHYVFLLPILLPQHIPATIVSINGSLEHSLFVSFSKTSDKINRKVKVLGNYQLPMVRTPPSFANSIADKPIYVNRVWNDSLHYIITFPKKYVALGAEHVVNVKLVPLVKDVIIKRIKFNVLERITYVSKNLSKEYDYDSEDPYYLRGLSSDNKVRERVVPLCELKTKMKPNNTSGNEPYKEEVIKCPENNLLFVCYEPDDELDNLNLNDPLCKGDQQPNTTIASPLDINIALPFLTTRTDKTMLTNSDGDDSDLTPRQGSISNDRFASVDGMGKRPSKSDQGAPSSPGLSPTSPIIGTLETNMSHSFSNNEDYSSMNDFFTPDSSAYINDEHGTSSSPSENIQLGFTHVARALYPDSNFRHVQIHHRLQVCFRISKPDPKDDFRMHHYEVVVDTPLILVSSKCNDESIQLPEYDEIFTTQEFGEPTGSKPRFRTPNFGTASYDNNGVTIKALNEQGDERLPSFEEATSTPSSPITRTFSISEDPLSRIPSISALGPSFNPNYLPRGPAPAYEAPSSPSPARPSNLEDPVLGPLNIDQLVNLDSASSSSTIRTSRLRSSLVSSFAP
ncbi:uncharacterized protein CANTADRAFT_51430, partial [Suhomyces tanzawaensis NRRL Y-17324]